MKIIVGDYIPYRDCTIDIVQSVFGRELRRVQKGFSFEHWNCDSLQPVSQFRKFKQPQNAYPAAAVIAVWNVETKRPAPLCAERSQMEMAECGQLESQQYKAG
jgi:hypothetical protein